MAGTGTSAAAARALAKAVEAPGPLPTPCWRWTASSGGGGYPQLRARIDGRRRVLRVHRLLYAALRATPDPRLHLHHRCGDKLCVNPWHLDELEPAEHVLLGGSPPAVNARASRCKRGHPLAGRNLYRFPDGRRRCRACRRATANCAA